MKLPFFSRRRDAAIAAAVAKQLSMISSGPSFGGWTPLIREPTTGGWQRHQRVELEDAARFGPVYACTSLICGDIGKLPLRLLRLQNGVWQETTSAAFSPVLATPNTYQNQQQFLETWVLSLLFRGNFYGLKEYDGRGVVTSIHPLNPNRVTPLVSTTGDVFYRLASDYLAGLPNQVTVPARYIIHSRVNAVYHPLCGLSPLYAAGLSVASGLAMQSDALSFFKNSSAPGGILTAPGTVQPSTAVRLKEHFEQNFTGVHNRGRVAVLGDGLKFESLSMSSVDAQLVEQLKFTVADVAATFKVPLWKLGAGEPPRGMSVEALSVEYLTQALQSIVVNIELCLDAGLALPADIGVDLDVKQLLRMDSVSRVEMLARGVLGGIYAPNEARAVEGLPPVPGGHSVYLQQQNYSLEALAKRDALADPFANVAPPAKMVGFEGD